MSTFTVKVGHVVDFKKALPRWAFVRTDVPTDDLFRLMIEGMKAAKDVKDPPNPRVVIQIFQD